MYSMECWLGGKKFLLSRSGGGALLLVDDLYASQVPDQGEFGARISTAELDYLVSRGAAASLSENYWYCRIRCFSSANAHPSSFARSEATKQSSPFSGIVVASNQTRNLEIPGSRLRIAPERLVVSTMLTLYFASGSTRLPYIRAARDCVPDALTLNRRQKFRFKLCMRLHFRVKRV